MTSNDLSTSLTLETVKNQLERWRETRVKGNRIPQPLWDAIRSLTKQYTYSQIASELKINPHHLQAKMEQQSQHVSPLSKSNFIEVPLFPSSFSHASSPAQKPPFHTGGGTFVEFTGPGGIALKASGLTSEDLCSLIKIFLG